MHESLAAAARPGRQMLRRERAVLGSIMLRGARPAAQERGGESEILRDPQALRQTERIPAEAPLVQHHPAVAQRRHAGAFRAVPVVGRRNLRRGPAGATIARAHDHVMEKRLFGRMQDERSPRRLVEHDEPVAVGRDGNLRMGAIGVRVFVQDRVSGVASVDHCAPV
ncbi:MAG: hypothetical protein ACREE7_13080 [Dongiaceae bacterium]